MALLRSTLPARWAAELAVALAAGGQVDAAHAIVALYGSPIRVPLEHLAESIYQGTADAADALAARVIVPPPGKLNLTLFGPMTLVRDGEPVDMTVQSTVDARELLAFLATRPS